MEHVQAIIHDVGPAHRLRTDVEELRNDSIAVVGVGGELPERCPQGLLLSRLARLGHARDGDDEQQHENDDTYI